MYTIKYNQDGSQDSMNDGSPAVTQQFPNGRRRKVSVNQGEYQRWLAAGNVPAIQHHQEPDATVSRDQAIDLLWQAAFPGTLDTAYLERKIDDYALKTAMVMLNLDEPGSPRRNAMESLYQWQMSVVWEYERRRDHVLDTYQVDDRIAPDELDTDFSMCWDGQAMVSNPAPATGDIWAINALSGSI